MRWALLIVTLPAAASVSAQTVPAAAFDAGTTPLPPSLDLVGVGGGSPLDPQLARQADRLYRDALRQERADGGTLTATHAAGLLARRDALIREAQGLANARARTAVTGSRIPRASSTRP